MIKAKEVITRYNDSYEEIYNNPVIAKDVVNQGYFKDCEYWIGILLTIGSNPSDVTYFIFDTRLWRNGGGEGDRLLRTIAEKTIETQLQLRIEEAERLLPLPPDGEEENAGGMAAATLAANPNPIQQQQDDSLKTCNRSTVTMLKLVIIGFLFYALWAINRGQ
ncbi:MAG: hypothetical protein F6J95_031040 [Leptolyngbya sp. SIO1E4]|nr:hypothetical protein [Leptolyngbya sp. SIO1E4]